MSAWTDLVKKIYNEHKGEAGYKLGDAMIEAKKQYKKSPTVTKPHKSVKKRGKAKRTRKNKE